MPPSDQSSLQNLERAIDALARATTGAQAQVTSYTSAGTGGGTFYYAKLGNLKVLWGVSATSPSIATNFNWQPTVVPPTGFFNSVLAVTCNPFGAGDNRLSSVVNSASPTSIQATVQSNGAAATTTQLSLVAIGV